ncbi:uncharacterized protein DKFZp434B061-like [Selaginella moellendorffii]|uniref:uncharacterized protein DKFZp434B061-like n=1 Tax=Selaginella moellendorffii TaxID=88036 RepID=UPI000D1CFBEB|nr:uncharacterized protein DKFZp434B061-like [Selaginella moellendorffii]|eukprot:XP_024536638.1 uncharacterized protein DKFZp434B061-like [Selaginella moellendorffii]
MAAAALDLALRFGETPTLDVFEDDTTIPRRKKRRSSARRVSFAEIQTVHVFPRDDEYATPPGGVVEVASQPLRKSPRLAARSQSLDSTDQNPIANAASEDDEEAAGPVDINHIVQANLGSPSLEDDITLDSTTFSAKLCRFNDDDTAAGAEEVSRRPGSLESDMSFTVQNPRRPPEAVPTDSPPVSLDRTLSMQYTEMVDAGALAQKRRRVFRASPRFKGKENRSPLSSARSVPPKKLQDITVPQVTSSPSSPARAIPPKKLQDIMVPQVLSSPSPSSPAKAITAKKLEGITLPQSSPIPERSITPKRLQDITVTPQVTARTLSPVKATAPEQHQDITVTPQVPSSPPFPTSIAPEELKGTVTAQVPLQDPSAVASRNIQINSQLPAVDQEKELAELRSELQEMHDKNEQLKATMKELEDRKRVFSLTSESCKTEHFKRRMIHKIQGWHITRLVSERDSYKLDISHGYRVNQSITIEGKGSASSAWIQLTPHLNFIEKGFPRMNSALLFQSLLPAEKHRVKQLKNLPAAMQQSSDLVTNLIQVATEARDCRAHHRCLDSVLFTLNKDHGICLQCDFMNYRLRLKITLVFSLQSLCNGQYPKAIMPCEVLVDSTRRTQSVITEEDLNTAIYSLPAGYQRFHRICACVATFLP